MEKIVYALWRDRREDLSVFNRRVHEQVAPQLAQAAMAVRLNLQDEEVADGRSPRIVSTRPQMDAVIQLWLASAHDKARSPVDELIGQSSERFAAWLVCESTAIPNTLHPPRPGRRTEGFSQIVFLGRPSRLNWGAWRDIWQKDHTTVAIETQSNFEYVQNLIVRPLTYAAPDYAAIVEECFPRAALAEQAAYFDAEGDPAKLQANQARMAESCGRFIDFDRIDCMPTSQHEIKCLGEPTPIAGSG
jgi:hypothetical protein